MIIQVYSSYNQLLIYIKSIKTTGLFMHFFLTFTLQLQFKSITYSLINSFHLKQLISQRGYNPLLPSLILSFFPLSLSLLKLYQGKWYHFHHLSTAFFLLSSSVLGRRYRLPSSLFTSSFLLSPSAVRRWYHPQPHCSRQGCSSPSQIYPVKTKQNNLVMIMHL